MDEFESMREAIQEANRERKRLAFASNAISFFWLAMAATRALVQIAHDVHEYRNDHRPQ